MQAVEDAIYVAKIAHLAVNPPKAREHFAKCLESSDALPNWPLLHVDEAVAEAISSRMPQLPGVNHESICHTRCLNTTKVEGTFRAKYLLRFPRPIYSTLLRTHSPVPSPTASCRTVHSFADFRIRVCGALPACPSRTLARRAVWDIPIQNLARLLALRSHHRISQLALWTPDRLLRS